MIKLIIFKSTGETHASLMFMPFTSLVYVLSKRHYFTSFLHLHRFSHALLPRLNVCAWLSDSTPKGGEVCRTCSGGRRIARRKTNVETDIWVGVVKIRETVRHYTIYKGNSLGKCHGRKFSVVKKKAQIRRKKIVNHHILKVEENNCCVASWNCWNASRKANGNSVKSWK